VGYQIAFDLYESATQRFLRKVQETLKASISSFTSTVTDAAVKISKPVEETGGWS